MGGRTPGTADPPGSAPPPHSEMKMPKGQQHPQHCRSDPGGSGCLLAQHHGAALRPVPTGSLWTRRCSCLGGTSRLTEPVSSAPTTTRSPRSHHVHTSHLQSGHPLLASPAPITPVWSAHSDPYLTPSSSPLSYFPPALLFHLEKHFCPDALQFFHFLLTCLLRLPCPANTHLHPNTKTISLCYLLITSHPTEKPLLPSALFRVPLSLPAACSSWS